MFVWFPSYLPVFRSGLEYDVCRLNQSRALRKMFLGGSGSVDGTPHTYVGKSERRGAFWPAFGRDGPAVLGGRFLRWRFFHKMNDLKFLEKKEKKKKIPCSTFSQQCLRWFVLGVALSACFRVSLSSGEEHACIGRRACFQSRMHVH